MKIIFIYFRYIIALIIRLFLIILSEILLKYDITYTDIDYYVFSDGSKHLLNFQSPFNRETYRYTPLLAFLVIPNHIININFGKILFVFIDLGNGFLIEILLNLQNFNRKKRLEKKLAKQNKNLKNNKRLNSLDSRSVEDSTISELDSRKESESNNNNGNNDNDNNNEEDYFTKFKQVLEILKKIIDNPFAGYSLFYLYNPFVISISTRGSSDCLIIFFILAMLVFLELEIYSISGILYGLAVHFKIYPIIYAPAIYLFIITRKSKLFKSKTTTNSNSEYESDIASLKSGSLNIQNNSSSYISFFLKFFTFEFYWNLFISFFSNSFSLVEKIYNRFKFVLYYFFKYILNLKVITFFTFALITFMSLLGFFYILFGWKFLYEYLIYHVVRKDHRHNYSLFSYLMYIVYTSKFGKIFSLLAFLPQAIMVLFCSIFLFNDLNLCLMIVTWIFVTFNKVVTAQYFLWYISILPLVMPFNKLFIKKQTKCLIMFTIWLILEVYWNSLSHNLEIKGINQFLEIWVLNIVFFLVNCIMIQQIISENILRKQIIA
jgi:phosphatidylinositol glycan class M